MTDEELKEKAEKYYYEKYTVTLDIGEEFRRDMITSAYLAGAKDNFPQWHKVAYGDLPKDDRLILLCYKNGVAKLGYYDEMFVDWKNEYGDTIARPYAWQYLPDPPKEM